jgi:hypothetical protein
LAPLFEGNGREKTVESLEQSIVLENRLKPVGVCPVRHNKITMHLAPLDFRPNKDNDDKRFVD